MLNVITRKIAGDTAQVYAYDGKMRLRVTGCFYKAPLSAENAASRNRMEITRYGDGSVCVVRQTLIDSALTEHQIECRYEQMLNEMEDVLPIQEDNCSSSAWHVGHSDDNYDFLLTEGERDLIHAAIADGGADATVYADMLKKPLSEITEDIFLRPDVFKDAPWYEDFLLYTHIGTCCPKVEDIEEVRKALKLMSYETRIVEHEGALYLSEGSNG